jgi:hypothetical protein
VLTLADAQDVLAERGLRDETVTHFRIKCDLDAQAFRFPLGHDRGIKFKKFASTTKGPKFWVPKGQPVTVYNIAACKGEKDVYMVEGEPDVWVAWQVGLPAFSFTGGARTVPKPAIDEIKAARIECVHVLYDRDEAGRDGAVCVANRLKDAGVQVAVHELPPSVGVGGDLTDLYGTLSHDDTALRRTVLALPVVDPEQRNSANDAGARIEPGAPIIVCAADVRSERVQWLWPNRIPLGKVSIIEGDPGLGKSTVGLYLASRVTTGRKLPDGSSCPLGGVVILSAEDGEGDTMRPRLDAAGADVKRVAFLRGVRATDGEVNFIELPAHIDALRVAVKQYSAKLVLIDPLSAYWGGSINSWKDHDVRRALAPLTRLAEELGVAIVLIRHLTNGQGPAIYRGGGSIGIGGAARSVLLVAPDPNDKKSRILATVKSNLCPTPPSVCYTLEEAPGGVASVLWEGVSPHNADALVTAPPNQEARSALDVAKEFLRVELGGGPQPTKTINKLARENGISLKTLERARAELGVIARPGGFGKRWVLEFPPQSPPIAPNTQNWRRPIDDQPQTPVTAPDLQNPPKSANGDQSEDLAETESGYNAAQSTCASCGDTCAPRGPFEKPVCKPCAIRAGREETDGRRNRGTESEAGITPHRAEGCA